MPRPCTCDLVKECRLCWLYHNNERYKKLWDRETTIKDNPPTLVEKIKKVSVAYTRWALAGFPKRTEEEIAVIRAICLGCDKYDAKENKCLDCGCNLAKKIPIATEFCRLGKWPTDRPEQASSQSKVEE